MRVEQWIIEMRRKQCGKCCQRFGCLEAGVMHSIFDEVSKCPLKIHLSRLDAVAQRAWPEGVELETCGC